MKNTVAFLVISLSLLQASTVLACTCAGISAPIGKWVKDEADASSYVFMGTIESVAPEKGGDRVRIKVLENFKGRFDGNAKTHSACQNFTVAPGDKRVSLVAADGSILGCSDYKRYATDSGLIKELHHVLKNGT